MSKRYDKVKKILMDQGLDALLLTSPINIRYFSNFTGEAYLLLSPVACILFTDFRYTIQASMQCNPIVRIQEIQRGNQFNLLNSIIDEYGFHTIGYEDAYMSCAEFTQLQAAIKHLFVPFSNAVNQIRQVKDAEEIELLQKAQVISEQSFQDVLPFVKPGVSELDIATELLYRIRKNGGEGPSFDPIIASGPNGALCHAIPTQRKLQNGDLVVMDFGSLWNGYCSDMTRTIAIGNVEPELKKIYDIVLSANLLALDALKPGITGKSLDNIARSYIEENGYGPFFGHSLGHGFGLEIHESPTAGPTSQDILLPGMTVTIEPGIYLEGKGGVRIEDCCVLTENGKLNFASTKKELLII